MKRVIIGDPHGRWNFIKKIYNKENPDEVIILGDYFDSFNIDVYKQLEGYVKIINLRENHIKKNKGDFIMLVGNHDMHYIDEKFGRCSGWNDLSASVVGYPLSRDFGNGILKFVYLDKINHIIYSHAGVSMNWFKKWCNSLDDINNLEAKAFCFTFKDGGDYFGSSTYNSPLWIRPEGLKKSIFVDDYGYVWSQIFGHTEPCSPLHFESNDAHFWCIDCISSHYLIETLDDKTHELINRSLGDLMM